MKQPLKMASIALAMSAALFTVQAGAAGTEAFTPERQARIGEIAADYLVAYLDELIQVSKKLQARQQAMQQQAYVQSALKTHQLLMQLDGTGDRKGDGRKRRRSLCVPGLDHLCHPLS